MNIESARSRGVAAVVASMALLASGAALMASPAESVPPTEDCAVALPVDQVTTGMAVDTLTVTSGTTPESFRGEVLGVLENGIAPGVDMIIADFASPNAQQSTQIDRVGIWQGMSGSPVYNAQGKLLGAVAYGLSWGPSTIAGITPYEKMDDYLPDTAASPVKVTSKLARAIAEATDVTVAQADDGLSQLRVPLTISGISQDRLRQGREERDYITRQGRAGRLVGTASATVAATADDVVDGGNLGAAISYGTITAGGVGTVTDVCGVDVVGFGHPMMFSGRTNLGLMPADALYVQPDSLGAGYKVANLGAPVGAITQDRLTGITGALGATPAETNIASTLTYPGRDTGEGLSHSMDEDWNADVTFMQLLSLHDVTIDAIQPGSEAASVVIEGTTDGDDFTIAWGDRYVSDWDIAWESVWTTADLVWILSRMEGVEITSITTDGAVTDSTATWRVTALQQQRGGRWVTVNRRNPALVTPGGTLTFRTELSQGDDSTRWLKRKVAVPRKAFEGYLEVSGGNSIWNSSLYRADTVAEVQKALVAEVRNDEVFSELTFWGRGGAIRSKSTSEPQDRVVDGRKSAYVFARR